ncbi:MAG: aspartate kinase [Gammaproteobacteria bacterium]|nr:aspartate kinase [Gammaproteobacteria bacterium]
MALIVQKYGGSSVGSLDRIQGVAEKVITAKEEGHDVIVVLSAMTGETDRLIQLAKAIHERPNPREYDVLVSTGEQVTIALLCIALQARGFEARSYTGWQAGIETCSTHKKARITKINGQCIKKDLSQGKIPVVAGFQGVDSSGNITTLGRGGSDTTAVALAAAFKAKECQIFTDVDGVYTTDPRIVPEARRLPIVTFEEMLELASLGAKVLQIRAVEFAGKYNVPVRVLSTFKDGPGTLITFEDTTMEQALVSGIAFDRNQAKITMLGIPDAPGVARYILGAVSENNIDVDMIVQNVPGADQTIDFSFTIQRDDFSSALEILKEVSFKLGAKGVIGDDKIAKLSIVGVGMRSHAGVATTMFKALGEEGINIQLISTSEIKISVVVNEKHLETGTRCLHSAFGLHLDTKQELVKFLDNSN